MSPSTSTHTRRKTTDYAQILHSLGFTFERNEMTGKTEVNGESLTDSKFAKIRSLMIDAGYPSGDLLDVTIEAEAYDNSYHPIKRYFLGLKYDGGHFFDDLVSCFSSQNGLFPIWLRKWMIGAVAKVVEHAQNPMLILDGEQGIGKSLFAEWLCSGIPDYFAEGALDADSKDHLDRLASKWIWEVGELETTMRKADRGALKNFITMGSVTLRMPYGKREIKRPAVASLIGTVNNIAGILDDPTGNRRFMICKVNRIDWQEYEKLDINKIWGEIYSAYLSGESWQLTPAEKQKNESNNESYQVVDPIELVLRDEYILDPNDITVWTSTLELTKYLQDHGIKFSSSRALQMELASTLKRLNLQPKLINTRNQSTRGYLGVRHV